MVAARNQPLRADKSQTYQNSRNRKTPLASKPVLAALPAMSHTTSTNLTPTRIMQLQQTVGNKTISRLLASNNRTSQNPASDSAENTNIESTEETDFDGQERTREEMDADVEAAKEYLSQIIEQCNTTAEVEAHFPMIKERFQLKHIGWEGLGTPEARVVLEINPRAIIGLNGGHLKLQGGRAFVGDRDSDVTFTTQALGHDTVGVTMDANPITPNHPQGGPPKSASLAHIMSQLPTNPLLGAEQKYIKGHLLNDNLGGSGDVANLFPITARANRQHEAQVESWIKDKVNLYGYSVHYEVHVTNINDQLAALNPHIDADFECEAYLIDAAGGHSNRGINKTIESRYNQNAAPQNGVVAAGANAPARESQWANKMNQVEWSSAHGQGAEPAIIDNNVRTAMNNLINALHSKGLPRDPYTSVILRELIPNVHDIQRKILTDFTYDIDHQDFTAGNLNPVGTWNAEMNGINRNAAAISYVIGLLAARITHAHSGLADAAVGSLRAMARAGAMNRIKALLDGSSGVGGWGDIRTRI